MYNNFMKFLTTKTTIVGIVVCLAFQLIFGVIWLTGYKDVNNNISNMSISLVNKDTSILGMKIEESITKNIPFTVKKSNDMKDAKESLEERKAKMIIYIPKDFSKNLKKSNSVIRYYINESNPVIVKNAMQNVAKNVTESVNNNIHQQSKATLTNDPVSNEIFYSNKINSFAYQMLPLMIVLAAYVGSMIMGLNLIQSAITMKKEHPLRIFLYRNITNITTAIITGLLGTIIILSLTDLNIDFFSLWGYEIICLLAFLSLSQLIFYILGQGGMLLNIIILSIQLVTSGAMVPRETLNKFYFHVSEYLPATYVVDGFYSLLFGGGNTVRDTVILLIFIAVTIMLSLICASLYLFSPQKNKKGAVQNENKSEKLKASQSK